MQNTDTKPSISAQDLLSISAQQQTNAIATDTISPTQSINSPIHNQSLSPNHSTKSAPSPSSKHKHKHL